MTGMNDDGPPGPEFSRIVNLNDLLTGHEIGREIVADETERAGLARRFGLVAMDELKASVRLKRAKRGVIVVSARCHAEVTQTCVVTLDPVRETVDQDVEIRFRPQIQDQTSSEVVIDAADDVEPLSGDMVDIGELVAEEVALSLNPYPRKPGVDSTLGPDGEIGGEFGGDAEPAPGERRHRPFAALAALKRTDQ